MENNHQKKIEKISQAIYLVSNHLKDNEPLKWELRKESIGFLSCIRSLNEEGADDNLPPDLVIDALSTYARDLISLLSLAVVAGLITRTNGAIISGEIEVLILSFKSSAGDTVAKTGFILSHDFFAADPELQEHLSFKNSKGQSIDFLNEGRKAALNEKLPFVQKTKTEGGKTAAKNKSEIADESAGSIKDKKDNRQMRIIDLLRSRSNLSVKDFVSVIPDCSEKTIQRELLELVDKGIIKKEGERRWSTYSLK